MALNVATLNLGGINQFPFEFHDGSSDLELLSEIAPKYVTASATLIGLNDTELYQRVATLKSYHEKRFSPLYNTKTAELVSAIQTIDFQPFSELWKENYNQDKILEPNLEPLNDILNELIAFDYAMVLTLREYETLAIHDQNLSRKTLGQFHTENSKLYANKQQMVINYLTNHKLNAFMLQEIPSYSITDFQIQLNRLGYQLHLFPNGITGIILPNHVNGKPQVLPKTESEFYENSVMVFDEKDEIYYIVVHLTSKSPKDRAIKNHQSQWEDLSNFLNDLNGKYILGGDFNHHPNMNGKAGVFFPDNETINTVLKKRTPLQAQGKKANVLDRGTKDHIITNIHNGSLRGIVETLEPMPETMKDIYFPNQYHPTDHMVVRVEIPL